jgi:hypothetical protein
MTKVDYLVARLLLIPSSVGLVNDQKRWHRICNVFQPMGSQSLLPWPIKARNEGQIQAENVIKRNGVRINRNKYKT